MGKKKLTIGAIRYFIKHYPQGMGSLDVIPVGNGYVIETYNAGWSACEEFEQDFLLNGGDKILRLSDHPIHIFEISFTTAYLIFGEKVYKELFEILNQCKSKKKRMKYIYKLEIT